MIEAVIQTLIGLAQNNLEMTMLTTWLAFAGYAAWYLTSINKCVPLTFNEANMLWKIHKQSVRCQAEKWHEIKHGEKIVGFECQCGYKHIQKCPISLSTTYPSILNKIHTTYKS